MRLTEMMESEQDRLIIEQGQEINDENARASSSTTAEVVNDVGNSRRYVIDRVAHTEENFKEKVSGPEIRAEDPTIKDRLKNCVKKCNRSTIENGFFKLFPIFTWLRHYNIRSCLPGDLVSGITVGVVHIPQSMAFSLLAGLPPVFGLYTSFYPVIIYTLMGTSRHISVGTFAVTSLLTQSVVLRLVPDGTGNSTAAIMGNSSLQNDPSFFDTDARKVVVASTLMFLMGIFQLAFGLLRLGFITTYLSESLIQAFTTGAAIQVVTSQTPSIFGITIQGSSGVASFFRNWIEIFRNLPNTHVPTLLISIVCIILLVAGREVNIRYRELMKVPLPTEVIVVIIATISSHFGRFQENFQVSIINNLPTGFPPPQLPDFSILGSIIGDAFAVAIVGFAISVSLSKMYAQKHGYTIDPNQELVAYGVSNVIPSFFSCFPNAAALARCVIQDNTGGKTQVVGIISVVLVLVTILVLGPLFEPLPRSVLGCIIIVGLIGILKQLSMLKTVYKQSKVDFLIWIFCLLAVVILGVDLGLLAGVIFSLFTVIVRTQRPYYEVLGSVKGTDVYRNCNSFRTVTPYKGIVIFKFHSSLYYANKDAFRKKLIKAVGFDPDVDVEKRKKELETSITSEQQTECCELRNNCEKRHEDQDFEKVVNPKEDVNCCERRIAVQDVPHTIIIDCSSFSFIDMTGAKTLKAICKSFQNLGINFLLANVSCHARCSLNKLAYYEVAGQESEFITVHDAALSAMAGYCKLSKNSKEMELTRF